MPRTSARPLGKLIDRLKVLDGKKQQRALGHTIKQLDLNKASPMDQVLNHPTYKGLMKPPGGGVEYVHEPENCYLMSALLLWS